MGRFSGRVLAMLHIPRAKERTPVKDQNTIRGDLFLKSHSKQAPDANSIRQGVVSGFSRRVMAMPDEREAARKKEAEVWECIFRIPESP
jgi:hypothetical protein